MLPDAIKNPIIYLNFAIYCNELEKYDQAELFLGNFIKMAEHMKIRNEYIRVANLLRAKLPTPSSPHHVEAISGNTEETVEEPTRDEDEV